MAEGDEELKKQLAAAADLVLTNTINARSPAGCPERNVLSAARIDLYLESFQVFFTCNGHANMPACRHCSIKGTFELKLPNSRLM